MSSTFRALGPSVHIGDGHRVLPLEPLLSLSDYERAGGGRGLTAARTVAVEIVVDELDASGLRGRGGAGFPTGRKWRTVLSHASSVVRTSVVVNAAEGEPGTYKDRAILRNNPYAVIEGALIAARVVGAATVTIATKERFVDEIDRVRSAIDEIVAAGWTVGLDLVVEVAEGPSEYLYGEETALLEVLDGRPPFPRIAPPWRRGVIEVVTDDDAVESGSGLANEVEMATADDSTNTVPPVLVNNVETMANVASIIAGGAAWFRSIGTPDSPGTVVCTVTGDVDRAAVIEVPMGMSVAALLDLTRGPTAGSDGGATSERPGAVLMGVSNAPLSAEQLDTPISYEAFAAIGSGLGSASFVVVGPDTDPLALAAGVSRFLAIESCGQCTPCKQDGLEIAELLRSLAAGDDGSGGRSSILGRLDERLDRITDGARCSLASQHQVVVGSIRRRFADRFTDASRLQTDGREPVLVSELLSLVDGAATNDETILTKQPDWTNDPVDSGRTPVERLTDHRADE